MGSANDIIMYKIVYTRVVDITNIVYSIIVKTENFSENVIDFRMSIE